MVGVFLLLFLVLLLLGLPIVFVLALSSLLYILISGEFGYLINMPQSLMKGINNFTLLALPFFILVGELMNTGGISSRIINFVRTLIGHFRGGLAYVNVVVSGFLSAIVGSSNAVTAITTVSIVPEMRKDGYSNEYSSALSAAASIMGPIIPPSMVLIVYAVSANVSVGDLFIAGVVPGILIAIAFLVICYIYARKDKNLVERSRSSVKEMLTSFITTLPSLSIPALIIFGIIFGYFTPTEAGAMGSLIAFVLGAFIYRELPFKDLAGVFIRTGKTTATILVIAAAANLFGWVLAIERLPQMVVDIMLSISEQPWVILLLINIILLIVGLFLEPFAAILIMVPVLLPVATAIGVDPVHFGLIVSFNLVIGLITPPVGITLFIVSSISNLSVISISRAIVPFLIGAIVVLLIITYIPALSTFLPALVNQ